MSWNTRLEIGVFGEPVPFEEIRGQLLEKFKRSLTMEVLLLIENAFEAGEADLGIPAVQVFEILEEICNLAPESGFEARCCGDEFRDTWIAEYSGGEVVFDVGPWLDE